jgi:hypothetical protein
VSIRGTIADKKEAQLCLLGFRSKVENEKGSCVVWPLTSRSNRPLSGRVSCQKRNKTMADSSTKDLWDKLSATASIFGVLLIPVVVAIVGNVFASAMKESENRVKYTELAISILKEDPSDESRALRNWAIEVINKHSGVPMSPAAREELQNRSLKASYFEGSDFSMSNFSRANFNKALFDKASMSLAWFKNANLVGSRFDKADLRNTTFDEADLRGANLSSAIIDQTTLLPAST